MSMELDPLQISLTAELPPPQPCMTCAVTPSTGPRSGGKADQAVTMLLDRIDEDPDLAFHLIGTPTYSALLDAEAARESIPLELASLRRMERRKAHRRHARIVTLTNELHRLEQRILHLEAEKERTLAERAAELMPPFNPQVMETAMIAAPPGTEFSLLSIDLTTGVEQTPAEVTLPPPPP